MVGGGGCFVVGFLLVVGVLRLGGWVGGVCCFVLSFSFFFVGVVFVGGRRVFRCGDWWEGLVGGVFGFWVGCGGVGLGV